MKVTIKEWNAVAAWRWDMPDDDVCGICRNPYDSTCSKCKFPGDECPLCMLRNSGEMVWKLMCHSAWRVQSLVPHGTRSSRVCHALRANEGTALHLLLAEAGKLTRKMSNVPTAFV